MGLFSKKYDLENDRLRTVFNPEKQEYNLYCGFNLIPIKSLNRKTRNKLRKKNNLLITDPNLLQKEFDLIKQQKRFEQLESMGYPCHSFQYLGKVNGTMSKQMEELLEKLTNEENVLLGVHRLKEYTAQEVIDDILVNGLKMTGHFDGSIPGNGQLQNNVSYYVDNKTIIKELMYANQFKNSKGSILIRIPDKDLLGNIYITDKEGGIRLNPKYIIGYVPLYENNHLENIITLNQIRTNNSQNNYTFQHKVEDIPYYTNQRKQKNR